MTKFVNDSLFGKNKAIKIAKRLSAISFFGRSNLPLTRRFRGSLIGTPMEYHLGSAHLLIVKQCCSPQDL